MSDVSGVRWGWLRFMYAYTIVLAGAAGIGMVFAPETIKSATDWPGGSMRLLGLAGSVCLAFALLSILGLRAPLKFAPILLLQLVYKAIWLLAVALPSVLAGHTPLYFTVTAAVYVTFVIGDLIAIPFGYVFAGEAKAQTS